MENFSCCYSEEKRKCSPVEVDNVESRERIDISDTGAPLIVFPGR
jgi:hypothetical protein